MTAAGTSACGRCGTGLAPALLACPACGWLVHAERLKALAGAAEAAERDGRPAVAVEKWQEALTLLPAQTRQAEEIGRRVGALGERLAQQPTAPATRPGRRSTWKAAGGLAGAGLLLAWKFKAVLVFVLTKAKLLVLGLTKLSTLASMVLSFGVYWTAWGWKFAAGLVLSMYVHEMGHVAALRRYGIKASAPMFVPGLGAFVRMKQYPASPGLDARVGLAGPLWGLGAAVASAGVATLTGSAIWMAIARVGAWLNLFNLLPLWQLDGGRAFRPLSRKDRWMAVGLIALAWVLTAEGLLVLLLLAAVVQALRQSQPTRDVPALLTYGALVVALALLTRLPAGPAADLR